MITHALARLVLVPLGLILGTAAALFVLTTLGLEKLTQAVHGQSIDLSRLPELWTMLSGSRGLVTGGAVVPPLLVVAIGEVGRIRNTTYYMLGGGLSMSVLPLMATSGVLGDNLTAIGVIWKVFATAGFVGGFVYWLVAGRGA